MFKKLTSSILLLSMLALLAACGGDAGKVETGETTVPETTAEPTILDTLPKADYDGAKFTILIPLEHTYDFSEEQNGETVNDLEFERDRTVEELYNVTIQYVAESGQWAAKDTFNGLIIQSVMANDGAFDLVDGMIAVTLPLAMEGYFVDLNSLDSIDLSKPWWVGSMVEGLSVSDKLFGICGSSLLSMYKSSYIMYANSKLIEEYQLEDPIQLVLDGKWTADKFMKMAADKTRDLNSDDMLDKADFFGYILKNVPQRGFQTSMDLNVIKNDNGKLTFTGLTDKFVEGADKLVNFLSSTEQRYMLSENYDLIPMFINDQAIFFNETILTAEKLRDMKSDFVMIPQPKYDEAQEDYYVQMGTGSGMLFIPKTAKNVDMTANVMNALACISRENVVPAYYEYALKEKYTRSEENKAVIDIINDSITMEATFAFASIIGGSINDLFLNATAKAYPAASMFESNKSTIEAGIEKLEAAFAAIK